MIFGFLLSTIFIPDISGAATAPRWAFAAVALPLMMMGQGQFKLTTAHIAGLAFIWYAAISLSWTAQVCDGLDALIKLVIIAEAFVYGSSLVSLRPVIIGFGLGMWVSSLVILTGLDVPHVTDNAGLFVNSNSMGEIVGLVLVAALFYRGENISAPRSIDGLFNGPRLWWLIPGILPAFILSHSRGAFVAVAVAFTIWLWGKSRLVAAMLGLGAVLAIIGSGSPGSIHDRLTLWTDTLPHLSLLGHGIGSFYTLYPLFGSIDTLIQRPEHLHNDWLEYAFELGIVGSIALSAGIRSIVWRSGRETRLDRMHKAVLVTLGIESCFGFPLHMAATAVLGAIVAGHAAGCGSGVRDVFDDGGIRIRRRLFADIARFSS